MFVDIFQLVSFAGEEHNIDPGCPKVAEFGRKLYHLSYNPCTAPDHRKLKNSIINAAVHRKICSSGYYDFKTYLLASKSYLSKLQCKKFSGIIFDYDGTLHEKSNHESGIESQIWSSINNLLSLGINIGVSTGRGNVRREEEIIRRHGNELFTALEIEKRNIIYVPENQPIIMYQKLCNTVNFYESALNPSSVDTEINYVFSSQGSKIMDIGVLMAIIDLIKNGLTVGMAIIENEGYDKSQTEYNPEYNELCCVCLDDNEYAW